jgi:HlyD family secretion protein
MRANHRGRWIAAAATFAAVALVAWALVPKPLAVEIATVAQGAFEKTVDEDGKTRVRERYVVSAPLAGRLQRVELKPGATVARGTLLATLLPAAPALLDVRTEQELTERLGAAEADQLRAEASAARARVAHDLAQSELGRQTDLAARGFTSQQALERAQRDFELKAKDLDVAQFERHASEHQFALARAALMRARAGGGKAGERWDIRSPVDGVVLRVVQESEAVVGVGAPIIELGDRRDLEVVVDVLTADAAQVRPGAAARLDFGDGRPPLEGRVRLVEPSAFTKVSALGVEEQRVNVVVDLVSPRDAKRFGDGYRVDAHIVVEERPDAILVPVGALFMHDGGWAVYVVDAGRARLRAIDSGPRNGTHAIVVSGLASGERVVVYPGDAIRDGVRVAARAT